MFSNAQPAPLRLGITTLRRYITVSQYNEDMKIKSFYFLIPFIAITLSCSLSNGSPTVSPSPVAADTSTGIPASETFTPVPTLTASTTASQTFTPVPTDTPTQS